MNEAFSITRATGGTPRVGQYPTGGANSGFWLLGRGAIRGLSYPGKDVAPNKYVNSERLRRYRFSSARLRWRYDS